MARQEGARSFDADYAEVTHRDGRCTFKGLIDAFDLDDRAPHRMARIVLLQRGSFVYDALYAWWQRHPE